MDDTTADVKGEIYLAGDLDDSGTPPGSFELSADTSDPEEIVEEKQALEQLFHALAKVPVRERTVFELSQLRGSPMTKSPGLRRRRPNKLRESFRMYGQKYWDT